LYCLANSQTPIFKTSPNPLPTIADQFNLTMPSDLDGDGDLDILTASDFNNSKVLFNDDTGLFTLAQDLGDRSSNG
jgi:hypothetical protein